MTDGLRKRPGKKVRSGQLASVMQYLGGPVWTVLELEAACRRAGYRIDTVRRSMMKQGKIEVVGKIGGVWADLEIAGDVPVGMGRTVLYAKPGTKVTRGRVVEAVRRGQGIWRGRERKKAAGEAGEELVQEAMGDAGGGGGGDAGAMSTIEAVRP